MAVKPKLAMIPSGYKGGASSGDLYSVLPSDGTGDFDFSRSGSATRINKDGLIETVSSNVPRLNYPLIDGVVQGCPSLLLENSATNLIQYSEDFSNAYWSKPNTTVNSNASISPDGTLNADLVYPNSSNTNKFFVGIDKVTSGLPTSERINSVFVKSNNWQWIYLIDPSGLKTVWFDVINGVVGISEANSVGTIEDYGNGWFRCSISSHSTSVNYNYTGVYFSDANGSSVCTNNSTDGVYLWGSQVEENYVSSYIPTNGSIATRSAETCNNAGDANTFNDSEGVLFAEISALADDLTFRGISISDGTSSNVVRIYFQNISNSLVSQVKNSTGGISTIVHTLSDITTTSKIALKYKLNDLALWIDGVEVGTDLSGVTPLNLSSLQFTTGATSDNFNGNTKQIQYFDTALTDTDLEELTSWQSFNEMAQSQLYKTY